MIIVNCVPGGRENERQMFCSQEINSSSLGWCLGPPTDVQSAEDVFALTGAIERTMDWELSLKNQFSLLFFLLKNPHGVENWPQQLYSS